jgi:hypothetical protein
MVTGVGEMSGVFSSLRHRGNGHGAGHARGADEHVDLVFGHQLARVAPGGGGVGGVVEHDELDLAPGNLGMLGDGGADPLFVRNAERGDGPDSELMKPILRSAARACDAVSASTVATRRWWSFFISGFREGCVQETCCAAFLARLFGALLFGRCKRHSGRVRRIPGTPLPRMSPASLLLYFAAGSTRYSSHLGKLLVNG